MDNRLPRRVWKHLPKRPKILDRERIDHGQVVGRGDLDQAQFGPIAILRDKLGVERDTTRGGDFAAESDQLPVVVDVFVIHGSDDKTCRRCFPAVQSVGELSHSQPSRFAASQPVRSPAFPKKPGFSAFRRRTPPTDVFRRHGSRAATGRGAVPLVVRFSCGTLVAVEMSYFLAWKEVQIKGL